MQSMTGFGRSEVAGSAAAYRCEIKSVNSRFAEVNMRLPRGCQEFENEIVATLKERFQRGKIDCFFEVIVTDRSSLLPEIDQNAVDQYVKYFDHLAASIRKNHPNLGSLTLNLADILRLEGALAPKLTAAGRSMEDHKEGIMNCLSLAMSQLNDSRRREGQSLAVALGSLIEELGRDRQLIIDQLPDLREKVRANHIKRLTTTIQQLSAMTSAQLPSEERIAGEIAIVLDKMDIDEELTRLKSHEEEFCRVMATETAGRKLDFLCQEMHREVNTISNKAVQTECAKVTVNMKQTIERIRQQVQNVE